MDISQRSVGIAFGIFFFYAAYAPLSNLVIPIGALVGERLVYLPSLGFCVAIGCLFDCLLNFIQRRSSYDKSILITTPIFTVLIIGYGSRTFVRNFDWKNPYVFFKKTSQTSPHSAVSHYSTGVAYLRMLEDPQYIRRWMKPQEIQVLRAKKDRGRSLIIENGLKSISKALEITKGHPNAKYMNVYGALLAMDGKLEQAKDVLVSAVAKAPGMLETKTTLGVIYIRLASETEKKEFQSSKIVHNYLMESVRYFQEVAMNKTVLRETPVRMAEVYFNLSIAHDKLGNYDNAHDSIDNAFLWLNNAIEKTGEGKLLLGRFYLIKAGILAGKKDYEGAIDALIKARQAGFPQFSRYILRMKQLKPLHEHPRFKALIRQN